jgi:polar amino acid transport system substrate-binding protein
MTNAKKLRAAMLAALALLTAVGIVFTSAPVPALAESVTDRIITWSQEERDQNLAHASIGVQVGITSETEVKSNYPEADAQSFQSISDTIAALAAGKIDYATATEPIALLYMRKNADLTYVKPALYGVDVSMGLAKGNDELKEKLNAEIAKLQADGTVAAAQKKWCEEGNYDMSDIPVREDGEVLTVAYSPTDEPSTFMYEGHAAGMDVEIIMRAAYDLGMRVEFQDMNFTAKLAALTAGTVDVGIYMVDTPEREGSMDFTNTIYTLDWVAMAKVDAKDTTSVLDKLSSGFQSTFIAEDRWVMVLQGLLVTAGIAVGAFALGTVGGGILCFMKRSGNRVLATLANGYCRIATGIPVLVWLMILYYIVFASVGIPAIAVAIICFGLEVSAPLSGVFSTGLDSVAPGEIEAAEALGFPSSQIYRRVVLPQAVQHIAGIYTGQLTALIKATSIVGYVAITDLTKVSDIIRSRTFDAFFPLLSVALVYFVLILLLTWLLGAALRRFDPRRRRKERILKGVVQR